MTEYKLRNISLYFPGKTGIFGRDEFASDCNLRQTVRSPVEKSAGDFFFASIHLFNSESTAFAGRLLSISEMSRAAQLSG